MGLVAPRHVGSSQTRDRTRVPCIGRRTLNHCATREGPSSKHLDENINFCKQASVLIFFFSLLSSESFSEDEWNLLYVAVTRARKRLIMTRSLENILTLAGVRGQHELI